MKQLNLLLVGLLLAFNGYAQKEDFELEYGRNYMTYKELSVYAAKFAQYVQVNASLTSYQIDSISFDSLYALRAHLSLETLPDTDTFLTALRVFFGADAGGKLKLIFLPDIARKKGSEFRFDIPSTSSTIVPDSLIPDNTIVHAWDGKQMISMPFMDKSDSTNSPRTWVRLYQKNIRINKTTTAEGSFTPFAYGDSENDDNRGEYFKFPQLKQYFNGVKQIYITHVLVRRPATGDFYKHAIAFSTYPPGLEETQLTGIVRCSDLGNLCPVRCDWFVVENVGEMSQPHSPAMPSIPSIPKPRWIDPNSYMERNSRDMSRFFPSIQRMRSQSRNRR